MPTINGQYVPKTSLPARTGGTTPTNTTGGGESDVINQLKLMYGKAILSKAKKISDVKSGFDLIDSAQPTPEQKEEKKKSTAISEADKKFRSLEDLYVKSNLGKGAIGGIPQTLGAYINPNTDYAQYKDLLKSSLAGFAKAGGDTGNIGLVEQLLQLAAFPGGRSNPEVAKKKFNLLRTKYGLPERTDYTITGLPGTSTAGKSLIPKSFKAD